MSHHLPLKQGVDTSMQNGYDLQQKADEYAQSGNYEAARAIYNNIISHHPGDRFLLRTAYTKIGTSYTAQWNFEVSIPYFEKAETLYDLSENMEEKFWNEWIELQIEYCYGLHTANHFDAYQQKALELKPFLESKGGNSQKIRYLKIVSMDMIRRYRWFMLPDEAISNCQLLIALAKVENDYDTEIWGLNNLGFIYVWRHQSVEARVVCLKALELLKVQPIDQDICRAYSIIGVSHRMDKNEEKATAWINKAIDHARKNHNETFLQLNLGSLGWLRLKQNNIAEAERYCKEAFEFHYKNKHPYLSLSLLPLMSILLQKKNISKAIEYTFLLLHPEVQRLPDNIIIHFKEALNSWGENNLKDAGVHLSKAITIADETGYL